MTARERAIKLQKDMDLSHVIYGYGANGKTVETGWETEMKKFWDDDSFAGYVDKMQAEIDGIGRVTGKNYFDEFVAALNDRLQRYGDTRGVKLREADWVLDLC